MPNLYPIPFEFSGSLWIPAFARKTKRQENSNGTSVTELETKNMMCKEEYSNTNKAVEYGLINRGCPINTKKAYNWTFNKF